VSDDEGALSRWSRRKAAARTADGEKRLGRGAALPAPAEAPAEATPEATAETAAAATPASDAGTDTTAAEAPPDPVDYGLPPIESLDRDSEYEGFLADGVPEALTRAALRKLWSSDPVFANLDGLNDYDEDFNLVDTLLSAAETHEQAAPRMPTEDAESANVIGENDAVAADGEAGDGGAGTSLPVDVAADEDDETEETPSQS